MDNRGGRVYNNDMEIEAWTVISKSEEIGGGEVFDQKYIFWSKKAAQNYIDETERGWKQMGKVFRHTQTPLGWEVKRIRYTI